MARSEAAVILGAVLAAPLAGAADDPFDFLPPGGRVLLVEATQSAGDELVEAAARKADRAAWEHWAVAQGLEPAAARTLAGYAALNLPLAAPARDALAAGDLSALPPDGRDLAVAQCQSCHSFFTGYLMQRRDETSWLGTFKAPFHAEIPMDATERATFAAYSALNMPLKVEAVPPELRF